MIAAVAPEILEFQRAVCEALGLDSQRVTSIDLHLAVGEVPTLIICQYAETTEIGAAARSFAVNGSRWELKAPDPDG